MHPEDSLTQLSSDDRDEAISAVSYLADLLEDGWDPNEESIQILIKGLSHPLWIVRSKLYELFSRFHDKILPFLGDALISENQDLQYWSIQIYCSVALRNKELLQELEDPGEKKKIQNFQKRIIRRLTDASSIMSESNQQVLITSLGRIQDVSLISFFEAQLSSSRWIIRNEAAKALHDIGTFVVPHLKKLIASGTRDQAYWSFVVLGQVLGVKAIEPFYKIVASKDQSEEVRTYALAGLKQIQSEEIIPYLIRCLSSDLWILRAQASETLVRYQNKTTAPLLECISSKDQNLKFWALKTLSEVVSEKDLAQIELYLETPDQELRFYIITALQKIGGDRAIRCISRCFSDEAWMIRKHASDSLIIMGEPVIKTLISVLRENSECEEKVFWILQVFSALRACTVLPALRQLLLESLRDIRLYAARAIAQIASEESVAILIEGLGNDLWVVRNECFRQLIQMDAVIVIPNCLMNLECENSSVRYWIHRYFEESGFEGAQQLAEELKKVGKPAIKKFSLDLMNLQNHVLEDLFSSSTASLAMVTNLLSDPFKVRERKISTMAFSNSQLPPQGFSQTHTIEEPNILHFEEPGFKSYPLTLSEILEKMVFLGASDLHLKPCHSPRVRVSGRIQPVNLPEISINQIRDLLRSELPVRLQRKFCEDKQVDWTYSPDGNERFRLNLFQSHRGVEAAFRHIPSNIPTFSDLSLPEDIFQKISRIQQGLILITGITGSGKSSTLASLIGAINNRDHKHIICIEDPIEYLHADIRSMVVHRQIGEHVDSFLEGLKGCLREDPDVILVGEMRDRETVKAVLTLAGTGHLVLSTLHTVSAPQSIEQIIQFFPPEERQGICSQLSFSLQAVVSQQLIEDHQALGRIPILEIMMGTQAVQNLIRDGKTEQLYSVMQTAGSDGMFTRQQYYKSLLQEGKIRTDQA